MVSAPLSNAWNTTVNSNSDLIEAKADLPKIDFVMSKFPLFEMLWAFLTAIILIGLARNEGLVP